MTSLGISPIYNIGYSPDFNAIEATFGQVKRVFNKARTNHLVQEKEFDMVGNIKKAFKVITPELVKAC
jgi:transposase